MKRMKSLSRIPVVLAVSFVCANLLPTPAMAWGAKGHHIVAMVAEQYLTPAARQGVRDLLGPQTSLRDVATYADDIRNSRPETKNWHFVDIPLAENDYDPERDCAETPNGDCVIAEIARAKATLADQNADRDSRVEALKFLVHFVGDLHQPLHSADNDDRGGNQVSVKFFGKRSNLHAVWDSGIIDQADLDEQQFADELIANVDSDKISEIQSGTETDWALEAHKLARTHAYRIPRNKVLGAAYYNANADTVDSQLTKAGLRLAKELNDIFH